MRSSQYLLATLKETPADAEVISHQLMLRAGLVRKLAAGLYTWLPTGLRVLNKIAHIVRSEMTAAGANEILMPMVQPADLWQQSDRWEEYGPELLRLQDRHQRDFALGPTHEEVITDLIRREITSYKQLPLNVFQIQTKFRDEIRPRFGIMRGREFTMKDAYSFHVDQECLQATYDKMYRAYCNIFTRIGLDFRPVVADTGSIGGSVSHEFHVLADSGEDAIAFSTGSDYAANIEMAEALPLPPTTASPFPERKQVLTPGITSITDFSAHLQISPEYMVKAIVVVGEGAEDASAPPLVALMLRGDHQLNSVKAEKLPGVRQPLTLANQGQLQAHGLIAGHIGPVGLSIPVFVDRSAAQLTQFGCGANAPDSHLVGVSWDDCNAHTIADIRNVVEGDPSPDGKGQLAIKRGIEVGHIFQLGDKYSKAMQCGVLNEAGKHTTLAMGCYGIGVSRLVAATIEQNHDQRGIVWPDAIAPFGVALIPMNMHKSHRVKQIAEQLYQDMCDAGIEVLFDDRKERPGVMFTDMELLGIPHTIVVGERNLDKGMVEYKNRRSGEQQLLAIDTATDFLSGL